MGRDKVSTRCLQKDFINLTLIEALVFNIKVFLANPSPFTTVSPSLLLLPFLLYWVSSHEKVNTTLRGELKD